MMGMCGAERRVPQANSKAYIDFTLEMKPSSDPSVTKLPVRGVLHYFPLLDGKAGPLRAARPHMCTGNASGLYA